MAKGDNNSIDVRALTEEVIILNKILIKDFSEQKFGTLDLKFLETRGSKNRNSKGYFPQKG